MNEVKQLHPSIESLLKFFEFEHLPVHLQQWSYEFYKVAHLVANSLEGPEAATCLRKLLEAKDCAVRAAL